MQLKTSRSFTLIMLAVIIFTTLPSCQSGSTTLLSRLALDQGNAYIAISANDDTGYNRWVPFYFVFSTEKSTSEEEVENLLSDSITAASFHTKNEKIYNTDDLIWSSVKIDDTMHNLTLVITPSTRDFHPNTEINLHSIELTTKNGTSARYTLSQYIIEQHDTSSEDIASSSLSSIGTERSQNGIAAVSYGISSSNEVNNLELVFSRNFVGVDNYAITEANTDTDDTAEYTASLSVAAHEPNIIFRPFLKITYDTDHIGWVVPSVPVYIA